MALELQYGKDKDMHIKRAAFDENAANYDRVRPRYCAALFDEIFAAAGVDETTRALEMGPGTGQATDAFLRRGCHVTAVELGENLAAFLQQKYEENERLRVWRGDFLQYPENERFDLLYSATAFHWVPREKAFAKAKRLLKPGGKIALFWNHPIVGDDPESPMAKAVQAVYARFGSKSSGKPFDGSSCPAYVQAMEEAGFVRVKSKLFTARRVLTGDDYAALMRSYSDGAGMDASTRRQLEEEMAAAIRAMGDALVIRDVMDLYLAEMPNETED